MAVQTTEQFKRGGEQCHCGHPRERHDPCSICECPFFRPLERVKAKQYSKRPVPPEADDGTAD